MAFCIAFVFIRDNARTIVIIFKISYHKAMGRMDQAFQLLLEEFYYIPRMRLLDILVCSCNKQNEQQHGTQHFVHKN